MKNKMNYLYKTLIKPNMAYFVGYICFILILLLFLFSSKTDTLLEFFNVNKTPFWNKYFVTASKIAEKEGILIVFIILVLFRYSAFILSTISISLATIVTNIIKTLTNLPRPLEVYDKIGDFAINFVPEVEVHRFMSFPSGHTAAAFALLFFLLKISSNTYQRLAILFLSISVAISRVYLFQHFTRDVLVGSIIGLILALIVSFVFIHLSWFLELDKKKGLIEQFKKSIYINRKV